MPVVVRISVDRQADGAMWQRGSARMTVEEGRLGREFAELFKGSNAEVVVTEDFKTAMWRKLCGNSTGTLSVLAKKPFGAFRTEALLPVALEMARECVAVARAEGAHLDDSVAQHVADGIMSGKGDRNNSMLADRLAGRPLEIEARNGVIVRLGERHGIQTPLNRMAVRCFKLNQPNSVNMKVNPTLRSPPQLMTIDISKRHALTRSLRFNAADFEENRPEPIGELHRGLAAQLLRWKKLAR